MARFDPRGRRNRAVLIGVSSYRHLPDLPGVNHNLTEVRKALTAGGVGAFRRRHVVIEQPRTPHEFTEPLKEAAAAASGLLLLYFAGHGRVHTDGSHFTFMVGESRENPDDAAPHLDSVSWTVDVLPWLRRARADRIVIILDCCHSGNAAQEFDAGDHKPMYLLAAVQPNHEIPGGDGTTCTPFTAELVRLLGDGLPEEPEDGVTFARLAHALAQGMEKRTTVSGDRWRPQYLQVHAPDDVVLSFAPLDVADLWIPLPVLLRTLWNDFTHWLRKLNRRAVIGVTVLAVLAATSGVLVTRLWGGGPNCPTPLELRLLTDAETRPTLTAAVEKYTTSGANKQPLAGRPDTNGCRQVNVTLYSAPDGSAVEGFQQAGAWAQPPDGCAQETAATASATSSPACFSPTLDVGPQPDIWIPASSVDVTRARNVAGAAGFSASTPLAYSPVVLAVPDALRDKLSAARLGRTGSTFGRLVAALRGSGSSAAHIQRPDPDSGTAALLATVGLYRDRSGAPISEGGLSGLEGDLVSLGTARDSDAETLCQLADPQAVDPSEGQTAAAIVSEHSLALFNRTDSGRPGCAVEGPRPRTAYYPSDVPALDHPFVKVTWAYADKDKQQRAEAIDRLHTWLRGAEGQEFFTDAGYRGTDSDGSAQPPPSGSLLARDGDATLDQPPLPRDTVTSVQLNAALDRYHRAGVPAEFLFVLDASLSMNSRWPTALSAIQNSLSALGPNDRYGIWTTPGEGGHTVLAPLSGAKSDMAVREKLSALQPVGDQARLAATLHSALEEIRSSPASGTTPRLVVLVTDDEDEKQIGAADRNNLVADALAAPHVGLAVVSLLTTGCDGNTLDTQLVYASRGVCVDLSDDPVKKLPEEIAKVGTGDTP